MEGGDVLIDRSGRDYTCDVMKQLWEVRTRASAGQASFKSGGEENSGRRRLNFEGSLTWPFVARVSF